MWHAANAEQVLEEAGPPLDGGTPASSASTLAVEQIVREHADFVFRTLGRFGVAHGDLSDMAHEVFVVVLRREDQRPGPDTPVQPWLYGIARRVAAGYRRRAHRRYEQASDQLDHRPSASRSPEEEAALSQARNELASILELMSLDQRAAFTMFEIEGMTGAEIATAVGAPLQTVFSRLRRARTIFERQVRQRKAVR